MRRGNTGPAGVQVAIVLVLLIQTRIRRSKFSAVRGIRWRSVCSSAWPGVRRSSAAPRDQRRGRTGWALPSPEWCRGGHGGSGVLAAAAICALLLMAPGRRGGWADRRSSPRRWSSSACWSGPGNGSASSPATYWAPASSCSCGTLLVIGPSRRADAEPFPAVRARTRPATTSRTSSLTAANRWFTTPSRSRNVRPDRCLRYHRPAHFVGHGDQRARCRLPHRQQRLEHARRTRLPPGQRLVPGAEPIDHRGPPRCRGNDQHGAVRCLDGCCEVGRLDGDPVRPAAATVCIDAVDPLRIDGADRERDPAPIRSPPGRRPADPRRAWTCRT